MGSKFKVLIAGIGGVGGYFGGLLAKHYENNTEVEIYFLARGKHLEAIQANGLKVIHAGSEFIARPTITSNNSKDFGLVNLLIIATKSYDLDSVLEQLKPCIQANTIIMPLLNGVDSRDKIQKAYPNSLVLDACVYIVSRLKENGVIENSGNIQSLFWGLENTNHQQLSHIEKILKAASIQATLSTDIQKTIWEKFIFLSPTATATSYFDKCIGELLEDSNCLGNIIDLISEVSAIANAKGIILPENCTELTLSKLKSLPYHTTSSMHTDYKNRKVNTEIKTITEYVILEGEKNNILTPTYNLMYKAISSKY